MEIKELVRTIPDYPKPGIMFRDITTLLGHAKGLKYTVDLLIDRYKDQKIDAIAGIEARGFILGSAMAYGLGLGFVPIRKKGKLPGDKVEQSYDLEYGTDTIEIHKDAISPGQRILLVDDLLATGGTALGAAKLIDQLKGEIVEMCFVIDLPELGGKKKLEDAGHKVYNIIEFEGE